MFYNFSFVYFISSGLFSQANISLGKHFQVKQKLTYWPFNFEHDILENITSACTNISNAVFISRTNEYLKEKDFLPYLNR